MMQEYVLVLVIGALSIQSLALIYVLIRMIGVTDRALARAQAPEAIDSTPPPPAPKPGKALPPPAPPSPAPISTQPVDIVDQGLVNFIKKAEGFTPKAVWDYKQYSIGYGTKANSADEVITEAEAEARLTVEIDKAYQLVKPIIPSGTPIGIVQALVDLTYNAGPGWEHASLGAAVKAAKWDTVKADILQYNHAGGQVNAGLTARREAEVSWFDKPL
jgi:lysozyme